MKRKQRVMDSSHSDSPTNLNNQSESWESWKCPHSARKRFIPDTTTIYSRRASLRSATRSVQTTMPSVQASHGPKCRIPEVRHEEAEKVGDSKAPPENCTAIEEVSEADKSMANQTMQVEEQNKLELEEPLAEDIQASSNQGERSNKNPSFSFITEIANMRNDEDEETDSVGQSSPVDTVEQYQVKPESVSILKKIISKHGDIVADSTVLTRKSRSMLMEMVCDIITKLQGTDFSKIKEDDLHEMIALVNDLKNVKVNIEWLHLRVEAILEARKIFKQSGVMKEQKDNNRKIKETVKKQLEAFEAEKKMVAAKFRALCDEETACKKILTTAEEESTKISAMITYVKSKVRPFINCSLVDDLL